MLILTSKFTQFEIGTVRVTSNLKELARVEIHQIKEWGLIDLVNLVSGKMHEECLTWPSAAVKPAKRALASCVSECNPISINAEIKRDR